MIRLLRLRLKPEEFADKEYLGQSLGKALKEKVNDWHVIRKSIDARQRQIWMDADFLIASGHDMSVGSDVPIVEFNKVGQNVPQVVIIGAGPAGLFAALRAIERGWKPIVLERGKPVEERLHDIVALQKEGKLNPESNFCFGEGGAGTFSDGKLFTRSKKRGNVKEVLALLVQHGAKEEIMYDVHPHIGSDRLPKIIKAIRETIINNGGEIYFNTIFEKPVIRNGKVEGAITKDGRQFLGPVILATGHSAHDVYKNLDMAGVRMEPKGFAMGVRLEHPQSVIDNMIYHTKDGRGKFLPPAAYRLTTQVNGRGVYSFCMCPGGVIVPAVSAPGESVVNGMSASGRSSRWANSGIVVEIRPEDYPEYEKYGALSMLRFQEDAEKRFYQEKPGFNVPAQRMIDFIDGKESKDLPRTSYVPGIHSSDIGDLLPSGIGIRLKKGLQEFGKRYAGFLTNEAVLIGLESRTSSPIRIPRDNETLAHPDFPGLYPTGEGAGFAGGIVSAAMDGRRVMDAIATNNPL